MNFNIMYANTVLLLALSFTEVEQSSELLPLSPALIPNVQIKSLLDSKFALGNIAKEALEFVLRYLISFDHCIIVKISRCEKHFRAMSSSPQEKTTNKQ